MGADVLLGLQWGDEGKGKIVDVLTPDYDIIARFQGGPNAGHTLKFDDKKHVLHAGVGVREWRLSRLGAIFSCVAFMQSFCTLRQVLSWPT